MEKLVLRLSDGRTIELWEPEWAPGNWRICGDPEKVDPSWRAAKILVLMEDEAWDEPIWRKLTENEREDLDLDHWDEIFYAIQTWARGKA